MNVIFTQKDGFTDYEEPKALNLTQDTISSDDYEKAMESIGLKRLWKQSGYDMREVSRWSDSDDLNYIAGSSVCYEYTGEDSTVPKYLVEVNDGNNFFTLVHVRTRGDLLALRIQLAQLMSVSTISLLGDVQTLVSRMFCALHGKEHARDDDFCIACDPDEFRHWKEIEKGKENRAKKQKDNEKEKNNGTGDRR